MARTERRQLQSQDDPYCEHDARVTETWEQERYVSHSKPCWMCGKGRKAKRVQRSKPRRQEARQAIREGISS